MVEAVPDANLKTLHIISAYKNKKDTFSDVPVSNDPRRYVQDEHQPNVSTDIVRNKNDFVNKNLYDESYSSDNLDADYLNPTDNPDVRYYSDDISVEASNLLDKYDKGEITCEEYFFTACSNPYFVKK